MLFPCHHLRSQQVLSADGCVHWREAAATIRPWGCQIHLPVPLVLVTGIRVTLRVQHGLGMGPPRVHSSRNLLAGNTLYEHFVLGLVGNIMFTNKVLEIQYPWLPLF